MSAPFPARLHALFAAEAPAGVVLRRGPANAVCSIRWNRNTDTFELGQWVRARVYERRADLSPDGRYLIYFARGARFSPETRGTWTAISRAPWLKAIVLYGKGNCWNGGGLFLSKDRYWLNEGCGDFLIRDSDEVKRDERYRPAGGRGGECLSVYYPRLLRDGWLLKEHLSAGFGSALGILEKPLANGWVLRKYAHADVGPHAPGHGCYWDEHELEYPEAQLRVIRPQWEWAERDGETVVWAEGGCLHRARLEPGEIGTTRTLFDFNAMQFERRIAPY